MMRENEPLAPFTTLGVGGPARFFIEAHSEEDIAEAAALALERSLPLFILGKGSNLLVPDEGVDGVVMKLSLDDVRVDEDGARIRITAGAGTSWDRIVDEAAARGAFGIENLAGIPGSVGGAAVQNIGAYGGEFSRSFVRASCIDARTGEPADIDAPTARFSYRSSIFKERPELIITKIELELSKDGTPDLSYADLVRAKGAGVPLTTPAEVAAAVRAIRARKFPPSGTAGSFFKNPTLPMEAAAAIAERFPGLPAFPQEGGGVKVSLAWLLDHALSLKGHAKGAVRLFENQPLVIVASEGARARDVEALAREIEERVREELGITLEREVETFGSRAR